MSYVLPKQNPSGHITYDSQQSRFHSEIQNKTQRLEKLLKTGQLVPKRDRNPLRAERSPRNSNNNFDCSIPNAPKEEITKRTWKYPEYDWGLPSKFESQKPIYDVLIEDAKQYKARQSEVQKIRNKNLQLLQSELDKKKKMMEDRALEIAKLDKEEKIGSRLICHTYKAKNINALGQELKDSTTNADDVKYFKNTSGVRDNESTRRLYGQTSKEEFLGSCSSSQLHESLKSKKLLDFKASSLRPTILSNPEIGSAYRASRAAAYLSSNQKDIKKNQDLITKAPENYNHTNPFKLGGSNTKIDFNYENKNVKKKSDKGQDLSEEDVKLLREQLEYTKDAIERQKLAIKLKSNPNNARYARPLK